jgi:diadenosine tetraphosphatase ApaH/serine/threonine PP2A family protein phosphatase
VEDFYIEQHEEGRNVELYNCFGPVRTFSPYNVFRLAAWYGYYLGGITSGISFWAACDSGGYSSWNEYGLTSFSPYTPVYLDETSATNAKHLEAIRLGTQDYQYMVRLHDRIAEETIVNPENPSLPAAVALLNDACGAVLGPALEEDPRDWMLWHPSVPRDCSIADSVRIQIGNMLDALDTGAMTGYWRFEEGQGATAEDSSLNEHDGTLQPTGSLPSWVSGRRGKALEFDGINDYVNYGNHFTLDYNEAFTVEFWAYITGLEASFETFFSKRDGNYKGHVLCYHAGLSKILWQQIASLSPSNRIGVYWPLPPTNQWVHIALTVDGTGANGIKLYYNGAPQSGTVLNNNLTSSIATSTNFNLGRDVYSSGSAYFGGMIDEFRIYPRALSIEEVEQHFLDY